MGKARKGVPGGVCAGCEDCAFGADYKTVMVSADGQAKRAANGHHLMVETTAARAGALDTVLVPGDYGMVAKPFEQELVDAVAQLTNDAKRIASVCTGAFLLAHAGLLNYRNATTHWTQVERFRKSFPLVNVVPDALFVQDDPIITSAGNGPPGRCPSLSSRIASLSVPAVVTARFRRYSVTAHSTLAPTSRAMADAANSVTPLRRPLRSSMSATRSHNCS